MLTSSYKKMSQIELEKNNIVFAHQIVRSCHQLFLRNLITIKELLVMWRKDVTLMQVLVYYSALKASCGQGPVCHKCGMMTLIECVFSFSFLKKINNKIINLKINKKY